MSTPPAEFRWRFEGGIHRGRDHGERRSLGGEALSLFAVLRKILLCLQEVNTLN
jgi:hypothetical protein